MSTRDRRIDPRVQRTRAAALAAARALFLRQGYAGTTMEEIAEQAGLTRRTLYNNYADKASLFTEIVNDVITFAEQFAAGLRVEVVTGITRANLRPGLEDLAQRLALGVVRPETVALRRMLIGEARSFPDIGREYFDRAPGQVLEALAVRFASLGRRGLLDVRDPKRAGAQFAYLVVGETLDRAIMTGVMPSTAVVSASAADGVATFLARFGRARGRGR